MDFILKKRAMIIEKSESAGYFTFQVEERDWRSYKVQDFLEEVKSVIPSGFRSYDPETFIWTVEWKFYPVFWEIRERYFEDKNQTKLFD